jgi:hypothetical protein
MAGLTSGSSGHRYGGMAPAGEKGKRPAASARRSATPLGRTEGLATYNAIRYNITRDTLIS